MIPTKPLRSFAGAPSWCPAFVARTALPRQSRGAAQGLPMPPDGG